VVNPLVVTTFHVISPNASLLPSYSLMEPCEYELLRICDGSAIFRIHGNFLSRDLNTGSVGIVFGDMDDDEASLSRIIVFENLTVKYEHLEEPVVVVTDEGRRSSFNHSEVIVLRSAVAIQVDVVAFDISIELLKVPDSESLVVNVTVSEELVTLCGLCGDIGGQLVFRDTGVLADLSDPGQVRAFIESWRVPTDRWLLRDQSLECGKCVCVCVCSL